MIDGIAAVGSRVTTVTPMGAIGNDKPIATVVERWTSPELKVVLLQTDTDPRTGEGTQRLTIISRDEPDASLFRPADDYRIITPPSIRTTDDPNPAPR